MLRLWLVFVGCLLLISCQTENTYAPVAEVNLIEPIPHHGTYKVRRGETLYKVAWRYGLDYRELALHNQIKTPYAIHAGQKLNLVNRSANQGKAPPEPSPSQKSVNLHWILPAKGRIVHYFSPSHKGINIAGKAGEPIYATANGTVVYSGDGLRGYGNLIILKHNSLYFSAYAHNRNVLVREGEKVKKGQKIAEMGNTGTNKVMLHFEIRRAGKPINPLSVMSPRTQKRL